ncbi:MAG: cobalt-precorrin-5B (C(1))-methyltransferase [Lachnospiraceae bacterium]
MRYGFTTGSCAAAASKAAAYMLLTGKKKETISIVTPKGIVFETKLLEITRKEKSVSCAVEKDGGDDPDITTGALVYAEVSYTERSKTSQTENSLQEEKQTETKHSMQPSRLTAELALDVYKTGHGSASWKCCDQSCAAPDD